MTSRVGGAGRTGAPESDNREQTGRSARSLSTRVHAVAGIGALTLISIFFVASLSAEVFGDHRVVLAVKTGIVAALALLVPGMAVAGATGRALGRKRLRAPLIRRKLRRTVTAAAIGLGLLVPCAVILRILAARGEFGAAFGIVQAVEWTAGAINIALLSLNVRDGRRMTGAARRPRPRSSQQQPR